MNIECVFSQVPQFFLEAGFGCRDFPERRGMVGVTQPRRVAAEQPAAPPLGTLVSEQRSPAQSATARNTSPLLPHATATVTRQPSL